jgi:arginyl-tRNA synthetase
MTQPSLLAELNQLMADAFEAAGLERRHGVVVPSARPDLCQFQCNGAMPAAKAAGLQAREAARKVVEALADKPGLARLEIAGPGFINITLDDAYLAAQATARLGDGRSGLPVLQPVKVWVDFGGPNVAKPLHVGHLRSAIIGDCLQRLHRFLGRDVVGDIHLGDWGTQMGMLIEAVREEQPDLPYFAADATGPFPQHSPVCLEDLERLYPAMSARCKADEALAQRARLTTQALQSGHPAYRALWRHFVDISIAAMRADFGELGVSWDLWLGESDSQAAIPPMLADLKSRGISIESEGAVVIPMDPIANTETPPLLLVKKDGGYLYGTTDLATLRERVAQGARRLLYVADKRQSLHFAQVFQAAEKAGYLDGARAEHVAFGTVNGKDGRPFKTRDGGVMRLQDLIRMAREEAAKRLQESGLGKDLPADEQDEVARKVAVAALRFADLSNHRASDYVFDLEKFTQFEGKTGPYLLYAAVRMKSILRKAAERGFVPGPLAPPTDLERPLLLALLALPEALLRAEAESLPHVLCEAAYDLAGRFSSFYNGCNILQEPDALRRGAWLGLTRACLEALETLLQLLGIETPERM